MPYVEGESLRERLTRERQQPLDDALRVTGDVADALSFAHQHGVVHRDIKAETSFSRAVTPSSRTSASRAPWNARPATAAIALAFEALGERDEAFRWLDRHIEPGNGNMTYVRLPGMTSLRADPRFPAILRRLGMDR